MPKYIASSPNLYSCAALPVAEPRKRGRPRVIRPPQVSKVYLRMVRCRELLTLFCLERSLSMEDIKGPDRSPEAVAARRDFFILSATSKHKLGCIVVAHALNVTHWTVQYWRNPGMRARKMRRAEHGRAKQRAARGGLGCDQGAGTSG